MWINIEGDTNILKQLNSCCSCLIRGFKCQDVLLRITNDELMLYSFPSGGVSSCFQFSFSKRLFDLFTLEDETSTNADSSKDCGGKFEFERLYNAGSLLNCFSNTQWLRPTRFLIEIGRKKDKGIEKVGGHPEDPEQLQNQDLRITVIGKNGITRRHCIYPVTRTQDKIPFHENIKWNKRHGIKVSSGLLKDIFNYMEIRDSLMTLSIDPAESSVSIKVNPIGVGGTVGLNCGSDLSGYTAGGTGNANVSTYQDIQIKREQIETLYLCKDIIQNNTFTFNSREFKVAIALAESCQLPIFITLRSPGSPLIVSIGQRAIIDQMCIDEYNDTSFPFEYHWSNILLQTQLHQQDSEYIEKTLTFFGFSAVFLMATCAIFDQNCDPYFLDFNSPHEDDQNAANMYTKSPSPTPDNGDLKTNPLSGVENGEISSTQFELWNIEDESKGENCKKPSFAKLNSFNIDEISDRFCLKNNPNFVEIGPLTLSEILPPVDPERKKDDDDWISTLLW